MKKNILRSQNKKISIFMISIVVILSITVQNISALNLPRLYQGYLNWKGDSSVTNRQFSTNNTIPMDIVAVNSNWNNFEAYNFRMYFPTPTTHTSDTYDLTVRFKISFTLMDTNMHASSWKPSSMLLRFNEGTLSQISTTYRQVSSNYQNGSGVIEIEMRTVAMLTAETTLQNVSLAINDTFGRCGIVSSGNTQRCGAGTGYNSYISLIDLNVEVSTSGQAPIDNTEQLENIDDSINNQTDVLEGAINDMNDTLTNDNVNQGGYDDFFNGFQEQGHGLTGIISAPLVAIQKLNSSTCTALSLPLPNGMPPIQVPCMTPIYRQFFGSFLDLYQFIVFGFGGYYILLDMFRIIRNLQDPKSDNVEVANL